MVLVLVLCAIFPAGFSSNVHTVLPENYDGSKPFDGDEHGVRNYVSEHELPRDVPTRVKIVGDLGTPPPSVTLDFVPKQTYVQVRRYDAVKRLPQEAAMEEAATSEEAENAPRLREIVTHKKTQEVYEEQGYEDTGYDHGGSKKIKIEEEIKDNQSTEVFIPKNSSTQNIEETRDHMASVAPSGQGTWSRHKTTTGKKIIYAENDGKRKVSTDDSNPISEKSSGNYTKFDGGNTIIIQNKTETAKKFSKNEGAESRRVASISKTGDNVEPTTYRPIMRYDNSRQKTKQIQNEQTRNRTRSRPRKRQEADVRKPQTVDALGSYDNSPWIPMQAPIDYNNPQKERPEVKKEVKLNSKTHESNGHATRFGYTVNHDSPYKYVIPTDILAPESAANKPRRKLRPKFENSNLADGRLKRPIIKNYGPISHTNYDGSTINSKQEKGKKSSSEDIPYNIPPLTNKYKKPETQFKIDSTHNIKHDGNFNSQRQKNKAVHVGSTVPSNSNLKSGPYREQTKKGHKEVESENYPSQYTGTNIQDISPLKYYDAPFITRLKKNNFNSDSRGDPTIRVYPRYEFYPNYQNIKLPIKDETYYAQKPISNVNNGYTNIELNDSPSSTKHSESIRIPNYTKVNNNRPKNMYQPSSENFETWENYPKTKGQISQVSGETQFNKEAGYPKFETNKRYESTSTKYSPIYRLIPYEKLVKKNNPYSYVYHDDHYPSGSRYSGIKVEVTTENPKLNNEYIYWNNRHPHLPKDSIKDISEMHNRGRDKSEDENTRHVENLTLAHFSGIHKSRSYRPLPLEYNERVNNLAKLLNDNYPRRVRRDIEVINIASSGTTTEIPVDTMIYPHYKRAPKQSALRYASNPILTPRKTAGGMEFYASTNKVQCNEEIEPSEILPERTEDGEWKGEPSTKNPKLDVLGDKIGCFKTKYFGSDPLDNPIFKEKDVGFPDVLFSTKEHPDNNEGRNQPKNLSVNWNYSDELNPNYWFLDNDKRSRRSDNNSIPTTSTIQDVTSIIPKPNIITFPTKSSLIVNTNNTKFSIDDSDTEVSANDEHVFKYSIQHPTPKSESFIKTNHTIDNKIIGLIPPPPHVSTKSMYKKLQKLKKPMIKKLIKKVKVRDESNENDLLDVFSPITSFFIDEEDTMTVPTVVHNFFNIKMTPSAKFKTSTMIDKIQNNKRTKRNMKGVDLQKPKKRKLNINIDTNVTLSPSTARVRMYTPKNGTWFREKRDHISVNVDVRRKEPRYYYHTDRPRIRVKRVVHNPPFHKKSQLFSSKYLIADQENSETLPEEINVAFSTTPKYESTPKFIPAIAFGDSKTKIINYNDSIANSTNDIEHPQFDKKGSLIYVINPDTGLGKWMQVIKVKNEGDTKPALSNGPIYLEKKVKDGLAEESIGKFGFKGSTKDLFRNVLGPTVDHRFNFRLPIKDSIKEPKEQSKKTVCPILIRPRKKEVRRRTTTTSTTTTEIPVVEEVNDRPEEQSGEEENTGPHEDEEEGENEEEQTDVEPIEQPQYQQESEENTDNTEDDDQDVHESIRKLPNVMVKKPEPNRYFFGSRNKNKKIT